MKCNRTFKQRPPANNRWWQWLLVFMAMLILPTTARAEWRYFDQLTKIEHGLSKEEPWIVVKLCIIDCEGNDGYFAEKPKLYINNDKSYTTLDILVQSEKDLDGVRNEDSWYCGASYINVDGVSYTVQLHNPKWENRAKNKGIGYVSVYIIPSSIVPTNDPTKRINISIKGKWKSNNKNFISDTVERKWTNQQWLGENVFNEWNNTTVERGDYGKVTSNLKTPQSLKHTTNVLLSKSNNNGKFANYSSNKETIQSGTASKAATFDYDVITSDDRDVYMEFFYQHVYKGNLKNDNSFGTTTVYKWYAKKLQGYSKPEKLTASTSSADNMWGRTITLKWNKVNKNNNGTWSIFRERSGRAELIKKELTASSLTWNDITPEYDTPYTYYVAFVPKGGDVNKMYDGLYTSKSDVQLNRKFDVVLDSISAGAKTLTLNWRADEFRSTDTYRFTIMRADSEHGFTNWTEIKTIDAAKDKNTFSYTDDNNGNNDGLTPCILYSYKVKTTVLGATFVSNTLDMGITSGSKVLSMQATKGDYNGIVKISWNSEVLGGETVKYEVARRTINTQKWSTIYNVSNSAKTNYYEDNTALAGNYYEYRVRAITTCHSSSFYNDVFDQGFCRATGIVSGRVSYGSGVAVSNVKVTLEKNGDEQGTQFHSFEAKGMGAAIRLPLTKEEFDENFNKKFTIQMLVKPNVAMNDSLGTKTLMDFGGPLTLALDQTKKGVYTLALYYRNKSTGNWDNLKSSLNIKSGEWTSITLRRSGKTFSLTTFDEQGKDSSWQQTIAIVDSFPAKTSNCGISIGGTYAPNAGFKYYGKIDEVRIFADRTLTDDEVHNSYNRTLTGTEDGLFAYWPLDEGIKSQSVAYDYSKTNGVANGNHGTIRNCDMSDDVPPSSLLSLYALTDSLGNYTVRGIPFKGSGTTYNVVPQLGIHSFNPIQKNIYVSASSLVHGGVDFTDESSFPVKVDVRYKGTSIPVEGCNIYVDGTICSKNGEVITTGTEPVEISVPIGKHFIQIKKEGHGFLHNGRYPADPGNVGTTKTFDAPNILLSFTDTTLVNFTGRIVGGEKQANKPLGYRLSKNNVGTAKFRMKYNGSGSLNDSNTSRPVESATERIESTASIAPNDNNYVTISTDPATGEFSAMLPPLSYTMMKIDIASQKDREMLKKAPENNDVDLSNPLIENVDTISVDSVYKYHTSFTTPLRSEPVFTVNQEGAPEGIYGIKSYVVSDDFGDDIPVEVYYMDASTNKYEYKYKYPLFNYLETYKFKIKAVEQYFNYDVTSNPEPDTVPLEGTILTISNALSADQPVNTRGDEAGTVHPDSLVSNDITLDENGEYVYTWQAGLPNVRGEFTRGLQINYVVDNAQKQWPTDSEDPSKNQLLGIILGSLPSGNNFVTEGPDVVEMILRDPPGSASSATWVSGTSHTSYKSVGGVWSTENKATEVASLGLETTIVNGLGVAIVTKAETTLDQEVGTSVSTEGESGTSWSRTTTLERAISTSTAPEFVGQRGDIFIGASTNLIFGEARQVGLFRSSKDKKKAVLEMQENVSASLRFGTEFAHTTYAIENKVIPDLEKIRNACLVKLPSQQDVLNFVNNGEEPVYVTALSPDDELYGSDNDDERWIKMGKKASEYPSYRMVLPKVIDKDKQWSDTIVMFNNSIANWVKQLSANEEEKIKAFDGRSNRYLDRNISFDGGSSVTMTRTTETTEGRHTDVTARAVVYMSVGAGFSLNGFGVNATIESTTGAGAHVSTDESKQYTNTFSYTLAETGASDALTVDVFNYKAFSPIFRTRGGQTSDPYEGEERTAYYEPDKHVISEATMQIEKPQIMVDNLKWSTQASVPTGGSAYYKLQLGNLSETGEDLYYKLYVPSKESNGGARLSIDGVTLSEKGIAVKIPALQVVEKSLQLTQTNPSVLRYDSIAVVLASQSQYDGTSTWDVIADTVWVSAEFVPSSSAVDMALNKSVVNIETGDTLTITFRNFDRKYMGQKAFRVQSYAPGATSWTTLREYVLNESLATRPNSVALPTGNDINYDYDMHSMPDGTYRFRILSVSTYDGKEITRPSDEIVIVKDMAKPRSMGLPQPSDGLLGIGKDVSLVFNENIVSGRLNIRDNFEVTAVLNGAQLDHTTALSMQGTEVTAQTEADIPLSGRDFAIDMWLNAKGEGTILSHGGGGEKFIVSIDADKHLQVGIGSHTYTSNETLPLDEWSYLTLSYAAGTKTGVLNAAVAYGDKTTMLFNATDVALYNGNGKLAIGKNIKGSIHELTLWDESHSVAEANKERQKSKLPSTPHLIGYWRMNEGEGRILYDVARNRHMSMPAATWHVDSEGRSVVLDGTGHIAIPIAHIAPSEDDNFAAEMWVKADVNQHSESQIMQLGDVALYNKADGRLQLTSGSDEWTVSKDGILDNAWHHIALNILRSGNAAFYIDGQRVFSTSSKNLGIVASDSLIIGSRRLGDNTTTHFLFDRPLKGTIDEVRLWNATIDASTIKTNRNRRLTGRESGLVAYYPFETLTTDDFGQRVVVPVDTCLSNEGHGMRASYAGGKIQYTEESPALGKKPDEQNVEFSFTASDNSIVINVEQDPALIEGCTINFTVKRVRDLNGNACEPICWSALVSQNPLSWRTETNTSSQYASASLTAEQELGATTALTAHIVNKGSSAQAWTIEGLPSWLKASQTSGNLEAQSEQDITLTVLASCPTGRHSADIYLTTEDGLSSALAVDVRVKGNAPEWSVDASKYESSMNVVAKLVIEDIPTSDTDDIVAAFIDGECRGVAHPTYNSRYDDYFVLLDVYANGSDKGKNVDFRVYDADQDRILPRVKTSGEVSFEANMLSGSYQNPLLLEALPYVEQTLSLAEGWNWTSLNVVPDDLSAKTIWADAADHLDVVKSKRASMMSYDGAWEGNDFELNLAEMYKVKASKPTALSVFGTLPTTEQKAITVRSGWNWIGFNAMQPMSVADAFAALDPVDGDMVKGKQGFAIFDGYGWSGTLTAFVPGSGYMYRSMDTATRSFCYPETTLMASPLRFNAMFEAEGEGMETPFFEPVDDALYPGNMTVVARVYYDGEPLANAEVGVFAADECRTHEYSDAEGIVYLTIPGDRAEALSFKLRHNGETHVSETFLNYQDDGVVGNKREPFVVAFGDLTSINGSTFDDADNGSAWYDIEGRRLPKKPTETGVYIKTKNGKTQKVGSL